SPSPKWALRWLWFSPVPSQTMLEFFGSTTTQHRLNAPPSSKIGVNVMPRFVVFHSPPKAAATYHVLGLLGSISMSATRPVTRPGPIDRTCMTFIASAVKADDWAAAIPGTRMVAASRREHHGDRSIMSSLTGGLVGGAIPDGSCRHPRGEHEQKEWG